VGQSLFRVSVFQKQDKLTNEQSLGQILQPLEIIEQRLNELDRRKRAQGTRQAPGAANEIPSRQELRERPI